LIEDESEKKINFQCQTESVYCEQITQAPLGSMQEFSESHHLQPVGTNEFSHMLCESPLFEHVTLKERKKAKTMRN